MWFIDRIRLMSEIRRAKALPPVGTKRTVKPPPGHPDLINWEKNEDLRNMSYRVTAKEAVEDFQKQIKTFLISMGVLKVLDRLEDRLRRGKS